MKFDFDSIVARNGVGNLKKFLTPKKINDADLISFIGAEFEFKTAPSLIDSVVRAAQNGLFGFTICSSEYLNHVRWWLETQRDYAVEESWIVPTQGTIFSVATTIRMLTKPGNGIIVPVPGYNRYEQAARRLGRVAVFSNLILGDDGGYKLDFDDIERKMSSSNNKIFVLCNPNNPTGSIWGDEDLSKIAALSEKYGVTVFSDEIFADVCFEQKSVTPYSKIAGRRGFAITCTSLGKAFGLTGVNHANVIIENEELRNKFKMQRDADHYGSIDPMLYAALTGAYTLAGAQWLGQMTDYVWANYNLIDKYLKDFIPEIKVIPPQGTYVLWMDFRGLGLGQNELESFLINEALVAADPGTEYYGPEGFMRWNISVPREIIRSALERLSRAVKLRR
ncbi:MAG: MalY/PatB family protein [Eubacteriales bacterium]